MAITNIEDGRTANYFFYNLKELADIIVFGEF